MPTNENADAQQQCQMTDQYQGLLEKKIEPKDQAVLNGSVLVTHAYNSVLLATLVQG